ncbi:hypothetical protein HWC80_gp110 [Mycobacterium phage Indlulamithi]|uniref:Uncharacterized protein n=1 Tax=Mycobacterium phage Indlulamithi TaxID=2656582 RepID=A0A649VDS2_9CAUD|nr:hypothetical protein HWC80_gp110 [Mycobacterium phage Indlulamithi]QGJ90102.1 hypothetical protein PBI_INDLULAMITHI_64 [Mycobacterium phage Indlulamithi]
MSADKTIGVGQCRKCGRPASLYKTHVCYTCREIEKAEREDRLKSLAGMVSADAEQETITIPISEYEGLLRKAMKVKAIREKLDEYHIRKKLVSAHVTHDHLHRLRRKTLAEIYQLIIAKEV